MTTEKSESLETTSESLIEDLNLSFEDICYSVRRFEVSIKDKKFSLGRKRILKNVYGRLNPGELTAFMGPSGAGKSTLLDILAGYTKPTTGRIFANDRVRDEKAFRRRSCYILQDDNIQDMLMVGESLKIAAELKLGNHVSREQKLRRVEEIITSLGLSGARKTQVCDLSGGQKKRLAIGLELVSDPQVLFLDEPTSGLDSSMSKQLIYLLYLLARQGRTVAISIHQPSATLLHFFDKLYVLAEGQCVYTGHTNQLVPYLEHINCICPSYHNPTDFLIEISSNFGSKLVRHSENGRNSHWQNNTLLETDKETLELLRLDSIADEVNLTSLPTPKEDETNIILLKLNSRYPTPAWKQVSTLTRRAFLTIWRNPYPTLTMIGIYCSMAVFVGLLFHNIGEDASYVMDNFHFLFYTLMFLMFTSFSSVSITFPQQIPVVRREHFNRWYSSGSYFTATLLSLLPTNILCTLSYTLISYFLTSQPLEVERFFGLTFTLMLVTFVALCLGLLNGSLFDVKHAVTFGPMFIMPFTVFSGFFLRYQDAPKFVKWFFHISFLKHGLVGVVIPIFGLDRPKLPCIDKLYCHYSRPNWFLKDNGMDDEKYSTVIWALLAKASITIILTYIILKIRLKLKW